MAATMVAARLQALSCIRAVPFSTRSIVTPSTAIRPMGSILPTTPRLAPVPLTMVTANLRLFHCSPATSKHKSKKGNPVYKSKQSSPLPNTSPSASPHTPRVAPQPPPPARLDEPVVLYEGPPVFRPAWNYLISGVFVSCGLFTAYLIANHLSWPLNVQNANLVSWQIRIPLAMAVFGAFTLIGTSVKLKSSKHITRMILYQAETGLPYVKIRTCTRSWIPRHMFKEYKHVRLPAITKFFPPNIDISPRTGAEFSVSLANVTRAAGSAVSQGTLTPKMHRHERGHIVLAIGGLHYTLDASGTVSPVLPGQEGKWTMAFVNRWLIWKVVRGAPKEPPNFSGRPAFDALIPFTYSK